jgi:uncharacterized protein
VAQEAPKAEPTWGNPGALGLAGFGFTTILLQIHNLGLITSYMPLVYGIFWGGAAQVIAGIIDGKRGDTFGMTAFTSYGLFWIGLAFALFFKWPAAADSAGLAWTFVLWGIFTGFMTIGTFKMTKVHIFIFASLTILFFLLAAHFFAPDSFSVKIAAVEGLFCGASAVYGAAAVVLNSKYQKTVCPLGICK